MVHLKMQLESDCTVFSTVKLHIKVPFVFFTQGLRVETNRRPCFR